MSAGWFDNASCLLSAYNKMNELPDSPNTITTTTSSSSVVEKQGIVSILNNSDFIASNNNNISPNTYPIRRTLSADMSSQKWLQNNGLPHSAVKRVKSSVQLQALALGEEGNDHHHHDSKGPAFEEIWSSIQADKKSWGCILSAPKNDGSGSHSGQLPPPYIHPLAKRTASSLSEKSLEICTESLGSETGSDGYSYPPSEPEDSEQEQEEQEEEEEAQQESEVRGYNVQVGIYKYNYNNNRGPTSKRSMVVPSGRPSSFPPPLPSLAHRDDGSNLRIRSHRQDGRLVVEAVAVPSQNRFRAQRQDGRLLLTFSTHDQPQQQHHHDEVVDDDEMGVEEEERGVTVEKEEQEELGIRRGVINVQRSYTALAMTKFMELTSARNKSAWPRNYNKTVIKTLNNNNEEEEEAETDRVSPMTQSLPPRPAMSTATAAAVAMNAYEYYWRRRSDNSAVAMLKPLVGAQDNNNNNNTICAPQVGKDTERNDNELLYAAHNRKGGALGQQEEVVIVKTAGRRRRGGGGANSAGEKAEHLLPWMFRGCKEPKKPSLLLWEPYCIATTT